MDALTSQKKRSLMILNLFSLRPLIYSITKLLSPETVAQLLLCLKKIQCSSEKKMILKNLKILYLFIAALESQPRFWIYQRYCLILNKIEDGWHSISLMKRNYLLSQKTAIFIFQTQKLAISILPDRNRLEMKGSK